MKIYNEITQSEWRLRIGSTGNSSSTSILQAGVIQMLWLSSLMNLTSSWQVTHFNKELSFSRQLPCSLALSRLRLRSVQLERAVSDLLPLPISHWECSQTTPRPVSAPWTGRLKSGGNTGIILDKCHKETEGIKVKRRQQHSFAENSFLWHMTNIYFKCK